MSDPDVGLNFPAGGKRREEEGRGGKWREEEGRGGKRREEEGRGEISLVIHAQLASVKALLQRP